MSTHALQRETEAARVLKEALSAIPNMDEETVRDSIEGQTSLHEMIAWADEEMVKDEVMAFGLDEMIERLGERRSGVKARIEARRLAIQKAMEVGELKSIKLASATLSLRNTPRGLEILDEWLIPQEYFVPQDPKLDRKKLKDDLKNGKEIPGCVLDNGSVTLSIRRT